MWFDLFLHMADVSNPFKPFEDAGPFLAYFNTVLLVEESHPHPHTPNIPPALLPWRSSVFCVSSPPTPNTLAFQFIPPSPLCAKKSVPVHSTITPLCPTPMPRRPGKIQGTRSDARQLVLGTR